MLGPNLSCIWGSYMSYILSLLSIIQSNSQQHVGLYINKSSNIWTTIWDNFFFLSFYWSKTIEGENEKNKNIMWTWGLQKVENKLCPCKMLTYVLVKHVTKPKIKIIRELCIQNLENLKFYLFNSFNSWQELDFP
jgi:hypothetical protein